MKFRFCGDLDAPDWILGEIFVMSKLSSVRMKLLVVQVLNKLVAEEIDYQKVEKLTADAKLAESDVKGVIVAIEFILTNAAKYDVDDGTLSKELQQLGLPKEHSESLGRAYREKKALLTDALTKQSLHLPRVGSFDWRVDYVLGSSFGKKDAHPAVQLQFHVEEQVIATAHSDENLKTLSLKSSPLAFELDLDTFKSLQAELQQARSIMEDAL